MARRRRYRANIVKRAFRRNPLGATLVLAGLAALGLYVVTRKKGTTSAPAGGGYVGGGGGGGGGGGAMSTSGGGTNVVTPHQYVATNQYTADSKAPCSTWVNSNGDTISTCY